MSSSSHSVSPAQAARFAEPSVGAPWSGHADDRRSLVSPRTLRDGPARTKSAAAPQDRQSVYPRARAVLPWTGGSLTRIPQRRPRAGRLPGPGGRARRHPGLAHRLRRSWTAPSGGFRSGELVLLGGPQGLGKTTWALQVARNVARSGRAVLMFSFEHDLQTLLIRLVALEAGLLGGPDAPSLNRVRQSFEAADGLAGSLAERLADTDGGAKAHRGRPGVRRPADPAPLHRQLDRPRRDPGRDTRSARRPASCRW